LRAAPRAKKRSAPASGWPPRGRSRPTATWQRNVRPPEASLVLIARKPSPIRGRCLVGESATRLVPHGAGWRYNTSSEHLSERPLGGLAGSPKAGVAGWNPAGGTHVLCDLG